MSKTSLDKMKMSTNLSRNAQGCSELQKEDFDLEQLSCSERDADGTLRAAFRHPHKRLPL